MEVVLEFEKSRYKFSLFDEVFVFYFYKCRKTIFLDYNYIRLVDL